MPKPLFLELRDSAVYTGVADIYRPVFAFGGAYHVAWGTLESDRSRWLSFVDSRVRWRAGHEGPARSDRMTSPSKLPGEHQVEDAKDEPGGTEIHDPGA